MSKAGAEGLDLKCVREVHQLEILPRPNPQQPNQAAPRPHHPNGVLRRWSVATKQFRVAQGRLEGLEGVEVQWYESPRGPVMREQPNTEFDVPVDVALLALGFDTELDPALAAQLGLSADPKGRISLQDAATAVPGIFAAGDLAAGASLVVQAIRSGRHAAEKIDEYLKKPR